VPPKSLGDLFLAERRKPPGSGAKTCGAAAKNAAAKNALVKNVGANTSVRREHQAARVPGGLRRSAKSTHESAPWPQLSMANSL
jgi:hypothetical protein